MYARQMQMSAVRVDNWRLDDVTEAEGQLLGVLGCPLSETGSQLLL
jgi:hypothetical protein